MEQGAQSLVDGVDPYAVAHQSGALAGYPAGVQEHLPYLLGVFAFGLARALWRGLDPLRTRGSASRWSR
jgi:hypothetical protein